MGRGYVRQETWEKLNRLDGDAHEEIQSAFSGILESIGSVVSTLAKNLYTSHAQFVFELLQNAEDNYFQRAEEQNQLRYVEFRMFHDRMVVDCNEDGFTENNLRAICEVGKSSKIGSEGYIGEKGIGFKSVFMAAWKVHIQSGDFSFSFQHRREESGLGMVTPIWENPSEDVPPHLTRMTLYFHQTEDPQVSSTQRETIRQQLKDLQGDILLFMRKLQEIRISIFDEEGNDQYSAVLSASEIGLSRVTVKKAINEDGKSNSTTRTYHVTKHVAGNLAKNENRNYSEYEETTKKYSTARVVLAFPLSSDSTPIIQPQKVFAFLPVDYRGFSRLCHAGEPARYRSDFGT
ncbi:hypothetical protein G7Z17_g876 [Cylindrodendrum hubeiense]|uniref:Sacsin/Nov domain-containing protein n=1 Tax=Cylindrodendrum hubeiense TaxID=595255 RepID=A0A9P5HLW5_9HYPO|nr:hypothetical protein G7Z17_g876 [Cylindrodendrum hubeiense]